MSFYIAFAIARWTALKYYKRPAFKREVGVEEDYVLEINAQQESDGRPLADPEIWEKLRELIDKLTPNQKAIIVAKYWRGKSGTEIASSKGCSSANVSQSLRRSYSALLKLLEPFIREWDPGLAEYLYGKQEDE